MAKLGLLMMPSTTRMDEQYYNDSTVADELWHCVRATFWSGQLCFNNSLEMIIHYPSVLYFADQH